ncbi:MAG: hypothetical protein M1607_00300, partial [Patescibacteria group bacterium]|nr:hypothetical protein [Patescibacteria group bacterium]
GFGVEHPGSQYFTEAKFWGAGNNQAFRVLDMSNGTTPLFVGGNSAVGINTSNPLDKFVVHLGPDNNLALTSSTYAVLASHNDAWTAWGNLQLNNSMYLLSNGNVGIGNVTPGSQFTVGNNYLAVDTNGPTWASGSQGGAAGAANNRTQVKANAGDLASGSGDRSGFFEALNGVNYPPGCNTTWCHLLDVRSTNNNYAMQFAGSFFDQTLYFRKTANSASHSWQKVVTAPINTSGTLTPIININAAISQSDGYTSNRLGYLLYTDSKTLSYKVVGWNPGTMTTRVRVCYNEDGNPTGGWNVSYTCNHPVKTWQLPGGGTTYRDSGTIDVSAYVPAYGQPVLVNYDLNPTGGSSSDQGSVQIVLW